MTEKVRKVVDTIKEAFAVFDAMELPMEERECTLSYDAAMAIVDGFEQLKSAQPQWISVEERLPTKDDASAGGLVLCICCDENGKPMMKEMHAWHWSVVKDFPDCFTHWMPLPEVPKEE